MNNFKIRPRSSLFFLHIPKTAGSSMRGYLCGQYELGDIFKKCNWSELDLGDLDVLQNFRLIRGHFDASILTALPDHTKTLTVLREPISRTLSAIQHAKRDPFFSPIHEKIKDLSVYKIMTDIYYSKFFTNNQTNFLSGVASLDSIVSHIEHCKQNELEFDVNYIKMLPSIEEAKLNLEKIDFVGTVENINQFSAFLASEMQYHSLDVFRIDNAAPKDDKSLELLSIEELELLRIHNNLDIELYDFARKLEAQRLSDFQNLGVVDNVKNLVKKGTYQVQSNSFKIDTMRPIPGSGWHEAEEDGSEHRWTGPTRAFSLELPLGVGVDYRFTIKAHAPFIMTDENIITKINGNNIINQINYLNEHDFVLSFDFSVPLNGDEYSICIFEFILPHLYIPAEHGGGDVRTLGISVFEINFEKLNV